MRSSMPVCNSYIRPSSFLVRKEIACEFQVEGLDRKAMFSSKHIRGIATFGLIVALFFAASFPVCCCAASTVAAENECVTCSCLCNADASLPRQCECDRSWQLRSLSGDGQSKLERSHFSPGLDFHSSYTRPVQVFPSLLDSSLVLAFDALDRCIFLSRFVT